MKLRFTKHFLLYLVFFVASFKLSAQVVNSGNLYVAGNMYVNYSFTNNSNYQNDGNVYFTSDFTNNQASMPEGSGTTNFIGTSQQNLNGTQASAFHHVSVSNSNGIKMNVDAKMGGTISPVSGSIYFNDHALSMGGKINSSYTNTKFFNVTNKSDLNIYGSAATGGNLFFDAAANVIHNVNVTSTGTAVIGDSLKITPGVAFGTVIVDGTLDANNFVTIRSDSAGTARIGNSAGTISNFVTVERYVPARRAWRFMAVPIYNDTLTIRTAWQEGANNYDLDYSHNMDPHPGYGTKITGDNDLSKGYDYNTEKNPSIQTWVPETSTWSATAPPTNSTILSSNSAYYLFIRGSRAIHLEWRNLAPPDPTSIRQTGNIYNNNNTKTFTVSRSGQYLFVGNPFASSIDLATVLAASSGVNTNKFYVWDPALAGQYGLGGYVTYNNGLMVPVTPNYPTPTTIIQSSQAFLLQSNSTSASITFHQSDKVPNESQVFARPVANPYMYVNLFTPSADSTVLLDGAGILFGDQFSTLVDGNDAIKFPNLSENIAFLRFERKMSIETRPYPNENDTLFLRLTNIKPQSYIFQFKPMNTPASNLKPTLIDKYLNIETALNKTDTSSYQFTANSDTASFMRRFIIVYKKNLLIATPHPVNTKYSLASDKTETSATAENLNKPTVDIYPNPVTGKTFILHVNKVEKGNYKVTVFSNDGKMLQEQTIQHLGGTDTYSIGLKTGIAAGIYSVHLISDSGKLIQKTSLVVNRD